MVRLTSLAVVQIAPLDGACDLYRKDGSSLGTIQPGIGGQPSRLIIESPKRG